MNVAGNPKDDQPVLVADNPPGGTTLATHFEGVPGQWPNRFVAVVPPEITGGATLYYQQKRKSFRVIVPPGEGSWEAGLPPCLPPEYEGDGGQVALVYTPSVFTLPTLEVRGRFFWQSGHRCFLNGATGFNAYARFLDEGPDAIRGFLFQRQSLGFNAIRIWTAFHIPNIGRLIPREHPDYYERIAGMDSLCAEYGQYPYWTCYAGANAETLGTQNDMIAHQLRLQEAISPFALLDLHNEFDNPLNGASQFIGPTPPSSVLWSQGSNVQDVDPPTPLGRFYARHPGATEQQRKIGKQNIDYANERNVWIPGVDDETNRMEPHNVNVTHLYDGAACGAFFCAGAFYHSAQAKIAVEWSGPELDGARAWCQGAASVPLDIAQEGLYFHRVEQETPEIIRVYEKILNGRSHVLKIHA